MTDTLFLVLFKIQALSLMLMKVMLLAKYFVFEKYKSPDWKAIHLIYFPPEAIACSPSEQGAKAKHVQNQLSTHFALLALLVILIRNSIA